MNPVCPPTDGTCPPNDDRPDGAPIYTRRFRLRHARGHPLAKVQTETSPPWSRSVSFQPDRFPKPPFGRSRERCGIALRSHAIAGLLPSILRSCVPTSPSTRGVPVLRVAAPAKCFWRSARPPSATAFLLHFRQSALAARDHFCCQCRSEDAGPDFCKRSIAAG